MEKDSGLPIKQIKVDGGMVTNEKFLQFLSNILILNCDRPKITETTALGAAYLVGLSSKIIKNTEEISKKWQSEKIFKPRLHKKEVKYLYQGWVKAVKKTTTKKNSK
jgi:glycerol kinase